MSSITVSLSVEKIHWPSVVKEIQDAGYTQKKLGVEVGCSQPHVSDLKTGDQPEPMFSVGVKMLRLRDKIRSTALRRTIR